MTNMRETRGRHESAPSYTTISRPQNRAWSIIIAELLPECPDNKLASKIQSRRFHRVVRTGSSRNTKCHFAHISTFAPSGRNDFHGNVDLPMSGDCIKRQTAAATAAATATITSVCCAMLRNVAQEIAVPSGHLKREILAGSARFLPG